MLSRLRARYGEARELVLPADGRGHLDWILGPLRNPGSDGRAFETELAELVVLWLEDLAVELNAESPGAADAPVRQRQAAAEGLQAATREFAAVFLAPRGGASFS